MSHMRLHATCRCLSQLNGRVAGLYTKTLKPPKAVTSFIPNAVRHWVSQNSSDPSLIERF